MITKDKEDIITKYGFRTTATRSKTMSKIKSNNTKAEVILRKKLWSLGFRYRLHNKDLPGKPDITFKQKKIAVFVDGEFWHGYNWNYKKDKIINNKAYWIKKIEGNIERDTKINKELQEMGWTVLRFWAHEIEQLIEECVKKISSNLHYGE